MSDERAPNNPYQQGEPEELTLGEALREMASRVSFASEETQRKVIASIERSIDDDREQRERDEREREERERAERDGAGDADSPAANNGPGTGTDTSVTGSGAETATTPKAAGAKTRR